MHKNQSLVPKMCLRDSSKQAFTVSYILLLSAIKIFASSGIKILGLWVSCWGWVPHIKENTVLG
jgi:hypothetical protein